MDWVRSFYQRQGEWTGCYSGPVQRHHRASAARIARLVGERRGRLLELGAGGGQLACALADLGFLVTAIDLNPAAVAAARSLAAASGKAPPSLEIVEGDFYQYAAREPFAVVGYLDGFGVGSDADQRRLLERIRAWLQPGGRAAIEVYTPWYWAAAAGQAQDLGAVSRRYGFDSRGSRMLDTWWRSGAPEEAITQSLRCYSVEEFEDLCAESGLRLRAVDPGGAYDPAAEVYRAQAPLEEAMQFLAILER